MTPAERSPRPFWRSRWWMPGFSLVLGLVVFGAFALGDEPDEGLRAFGVMAVVALVFLVGGRSETLRGLGGPGRDERWAMIDLRATAFAGAVVLVSVLAAWLYEVASGRDGGEYARLAAIGGLAYLVGVAWQRYRA